MVLLSLSCVKLGLSNFFTVSWPHGLGNWQHGVVIFIMGEEGAK